MCYTQYFTIALATSKHNTYVYYVFFTCFCETYIESRTRGFEHFCRNAVTSDIDPSCALTSTNENRD